MPKFENVAVERMVEPAQHPPVNSVSCADIPINSSGKLLYRSKVTKACDVCRKKKIKCSGGYPCIDCASFNSVCSYSQPQRKRGRKPKRVAEDSETFHQAVEGIVRNDPSFTQAIPMLERSTELIQVYPSPGASHSLSHKMISSDAQDEIYELDRSSSSISPDKGLPQYQYRYMALVNLHTDEPIRHNLIELFFQLYSSHFAFFSERILLKLIPEEPTAILRAMYLLVIYQHSHDNTFTYYDEEEFYQSAKDAVQQSIRRPSCATIVAIVIFLLYLGGRKNAAMPLVYYATAIGMSRMLRLENDSSYSGLCQEEQTLRRIVWWSLYDSDRFITIMFRTNFYVHMGPTKLQYPTPPVSSLNVRPQDIECNSQKDDYATSLLTPWYSSHWEYHLDLCCILTEAHNFGLMETRIYKRTNNDYNHYVRLSEERFRIDTLLKMWHSKLPSQLKTVQGQYTADNTTSILSWRAAFTLAMYHRTKISLHLPSFIRMVNHHVGSQLHQDTSFIPCLTSALEVHKLSRVFLSHNADGRYVPPTLTISFAMASQMFALVAFFKPSLPTSLSLLDDDILQMLTDFLTLTSTLKKLWPVCGIDDEMIRNCLQFRSGKFLSKSDFTRLIK